VEARRFDVYDEMFATRIDFESYATKTSSAVIELAMRILGEPRPTDLELARLGGIAYAIAGLARSFAYHASPGKIFLPDGIWGRLGVGFADVPAARPTAAPRAALADWRQAARGHPDRIRDRVAELPDRFLPALLPVALVRAYLARMERPDYEPFRAAVEIPQWRRQWLLWRASRNPRRIAGGWPPP